MTAESILDESIFSINEVIKEVRACQKKDILTKNYHKLIMAEVMLRVAMDDLRIVMESERDENPEPQPETFDLVSFSHRICDAISRGMMIR